MPREPIVIELEDGETTRIEFQAGAHTTQIEAEARCRDQGGYPGPHVCIHRAEHDHNFEAHVGNVPLVADPARAAVLEDRKRVRACVETVLASWGYHLEDHALQELLAAIDPPPETVSEYERGYARGATHVQKLSAQIAYDKRLVATESDGASMACRDIEYAIRDITTEPTP